MYFWLILPWLFYFFACLWKKAQLENLLVLMSFCLTRFVDIRLISTDVVKIIIHKKKWFESLEPSQRSRQVYTMLTISCINYTHFSLDELLQDNAALQKCFPLRDFQQYCEHIGNKKLKSTMMLKKQNTKEKQMKITRCCIASIWNPSKYFNKNLYFKPLPIFFFSSKNDVMSLYNLQRNWYLWPK